jgi:hypothetical protein
MSELMPGWLGQDAAKKAFDDLGASNYSDKIGKRDLPKKGKAMLYAFIRKVLGHDNPLYAQEIGDCVSHGFKNALHAKEAVDIALNGEAEKWRPVYPPFIYGASRVWVGGGRLWGDGSVGAWAVEAAKKYGVLFSDETGVAPYSGAIAKSWGRSGPPKNFEDNFAIHYPLTDYAKVNSAQEAADNLLSGRSVTIASNQGFTYKTDSRQFMTPKGVWGHQMALIGCDLDYKYPFFVIENSWGPNVFERLKDFDTGELLPDCTLRVDFDVVDKMIKQDDTWALSSFNGFPDNSKQITEAMFNFI